MNLMKVCEICGSINEATELDNEENPSKILHICENCREERKTALD
jgi:hypothetical protein